MFHYLNIRSFATAFECMKLHSKVWPCPHPAIKKCVPLLLHACKEFHRSAVSQLIFAKQGLISYPDFARCDRSHLVAAVKSVIAE